MSYVALKGGSGEWPDGRPSFPKDWFEQAEARTLRGGGGDSRGPRRSPTPADREKCRFCDFRDVCRVEARAGETAAEGA